MMRDLSNHGVSKEPVNPLWARTYWFHWCTNQNQWCKITLIMVLQRNQWIHPGHRFNGSFDAPIRTNDTRSPWSHCIKGTMLFLKGAHCTLELSGFMQVAANIHSLWFHIMHGLSQSSIFQYEQNLLKLPFHMWEGKTAFSFASLRCFDFIKCQDQDRDFKVF